MPRAVANDDTAELRQLVEILQDEVEELEARGFVGRTVAKALAPHRQRLPVICVIDADGHRLAEAQVPTEPDLLIAWLRRGSRPRQAASSLTSRPIRNTRSAARIVSGRWATLMRVISRRRRVSLMCRSRSTSRCAVPSSRKRILGRR